jgi:hypothetical protein
MTLAVSSRVQMAYIQESVFGTVPGAGNYRNLRVTGESLNFDYTKEESKEIRSDRQTSGASTTDANAAGSINFHLQYAEYENFMQGALQNSWAVYGTNGVGTTFSATFAVNSVTAAVAPTGSSDFTTLKKGQWIKLVAPTHGNDGKIVRVSTTVAPTTTVITLDANTPILTGSGIANSGVTAARLTNSTNQFSYSIEKQFLDIVQFLTFRGMNVNKMNVNFSAAALTDGSFEFMGKDVQQGVATKLPGTVVPSYSYDIQNSVRGVGQMWENNAPISSTFVKSITLTVNNNLRGQKAVGNLGNVGVGSGDLNINGTIEMYFADASVFTRFLTDTYTSLIIGTQDNSSGTGNGYVISLPRVLLMNAKIIAQGENQDVMASFDYSAFSDDANADATLRKTIFIDRTGAAVV